MSTVELDIQAALETRARDVLHPIVGEAVEWPNILLKPPSGAPWARVSHLFARTTPAGVGVDSFTRHPGILQLSFFFPLGGGERASVTAAQAVCDAFKRGTILTQGSTSVRIQSASRATGMRDGGWWMTPVSVTWLVHSLD